MHILLDTDRLVLRRFTDNDVNDLFDLHGDPDVMRYLTGGQPTPRDVIEQKIVPRFFRYDDTGFGFYAATEKGGGAFAGWFGLHATHPAADEAELGFRLRKGVWGRGYATEGARALIRHAFTHLGVRRVIGHTYEHNLASRRVMEKAGMTFVRRFRLTPEELAAATTFDGTSQAVWEGEDVEYAIGQCSS